MSRRFIAAVALVLLAAAPRAAVAQTPDRLQLDLSGAVANTMVSPVIMAADQLKPPPNLGPVARKSQGTSLLHALYASTFAMQALDVHSTLHAFNAGAVEGNQLMTGVTRNKMAFIGLKAGVAASTVLAAHNMAKTNKVAAMATLIGINSAYAIIVSHNYRVANRLK